MKKLTLFFTISLVARITLSVLFGYLATQENSSVPSQVQTETSHHLSTDDEIIGYYMEDFGLSYEEAEELLFQGTMTN